jgi:hypothetical protein
VKYTEIKAVMVFRVNNAPPIFVGRLNGVPVAKSTHQGTQLKRRTTLCLSELRDHPENNFFAFFTGP